MRRGFALGLIAVAASFVVSGAQGSPSAASARNGLIAFVHGAQIFTMTASGANVRRLTSSSRENSEPSFSPDGRRILFVRRSRNGQFDLWTMNANGSHQSRFTWTRRISEEAPAWSPDGAQIVFERVRDRGHSREIWIMNRNGSDRRLLTGQGAEPRWSPDGSLIAFAGPDGICVILAAGGQTTVLDPKHDDGGLSWTPDGRIVFARWVPVAPHSNGIQTDLWVMDADGSDLHRITHTPGLDEDEPVWAPGATKILFAAQPNGMSNQLGGTGGPGIELYATDTNGKNRRQLTHGKTYESTNLDPSWQPLR